MRTVWLVCAAACAACGATSAEVKTAQDTLYEVPPPKLYFAAAEVTQGMYRIAERGLRDCAFATERRYYSPTGDLESKGAGDFYHFAPDTVGVSFVVRVVATDFKGSYSVSVVPDTIQILQGSPQPRKLRPDDPYLPPFVKGRADALALAIHDHLVGLTGSTKQWWNRPLRCDGGNDDDP